MASNANWELAVQRRMTHFLENLDKALDKEESWPSCDTALLLGSAEIAEATLVRWLARPLMDRPDWLVAYSGGLIHFARAVPLN